MLSESVGGCPKERDELHSGSYRYAVLRAGSTSKVRDSKRRLLTDRWPQQLHYISRRLVREVVQQDEASRRRTPVNFGVAIGPLSAGFGAKEVDYDNSYDLARRATAALAANTGSLSNLGPYIRATADVRSCWMYVFGGWASSYDQAIATFFVRARTRRGRRVFIALVGSISNYIGHVEEPRTAGWHPSDAMGLYSILQTVLENTDDGVAPEWLSDDSRYVTAQRFDTAGTLEREFRQRFTPRRQEFLAVVHDAVENVKIGGRRYHLGLLGAPLWVASPTGTATR